MAASSAASSAASATASAASAGAASVFAVASARSATVGSIDVATVGIVANTVDRAVRFPWKGHACESIATLRTRLPCNHPSWRRRQQRQIALRGEIALELLNKIFAPQARRASTSESSQRSGQCVAIDTAESIHLRMVVTMMVMVVMWAIAW